MDLPTSLASRPFTVAEGRTAGISATVLRRSDLRTSWWGVRASPELPDSLPATCAAALAAVAAPAVISHVTALRLHGVEVPWRLDGDHRVHLTVPRPPVSRRRGLAMHVASVPLPTTRLGGLPLTSVAATWWQLSSQLDPDDLIVLADSMMRRTSPLTSVDELAAVVANRPAGARGRRRALGALEHARPGTDSSMETRARLCLVRAGLPTPLVNVPVHDASGRFLAMPDMHFETERIAIEYDGDVHRVDPRTWRRDVERRQRLEDEGWVVVTATADDVLRSPERLVRRVDRLLRRRG